MSDFDPKAYWETRLRREGGLKGVGYTPLGEQYNRWMYRLRRLVFLRRMRATSLDFADRQVLDVGSGTGFYVGLWAELGAGTIVGSDMTHVATEELRGKYPGREFVQLDITGDTSVLDGRRFDIVSAFDVLFHIVDDALYERAIRNIHDLLKPGGLFVLSDLFLHHETERTTTLVARSLDHVERALHDGGFQVLQRRPVFVLMNQPVDSSSRFPRKLWKAVVRTACLLEGTGFLLGACLYPLESLCVSHLKESPSTEMMICRRAD